MEAKSYFSVHSPMLRKQVTICFLPKQIFKMFCLVAERISYNFMNCGLRESCLLLRHYWRESYPQGTNPSAFAACWQVFNSSFKISVLKMTCRWNDPVTKDPTEYQSALCCVFRNDFANVQIRSFLLAPKFEVKMSSKRSKIVSFVFDIASKRRNGCSFLGWLTVIYRKGHCLPTYSLDIPVNPFNRSTPSVQKSATYWKHVFDHQACRHHYFPWCLQGIELSFFHSRRL